MDFSNYQRLRLSRSQRILTIALDNGKVNAVDALMHQ